MLDLQKKAQINLQTPPANRLDAKFMSGHRDPKTVMRYDHGRENLEQNAINFISFDVDNTQNHK